MTLPEFCLRRPVMTSLLAISVTLFGLLSFRGLPVSYLPSVDFPTIMVSASYPGASPENMASSVAVPLENQFATIDGVTSMTSASQLGSTKITLQFSLNRNINDCALDVISAITAAGRNLPSDMPNPPTLRKINPSLSPVMIFSLHSDTLPLTDVDYYAETLIAQRMSMVEGVAEVTVYGSQKRAVRVRVDPARLASHGLSVLDVGTALDKGNANSPVGLLSGANRTYTLDTNGPLPAAADYLDLVLANAGGGRVLRLGDVASAADLPENSYIGTWMNGRPAVSLAVQRQPGANTVAVANGIRALLPELSGVVPASVAFELIYDGSQPVVDSVREVVWTIVHTVILVILITYVFLQNLRATVIPSFALPISLLATGLVFSYMGYSVDTLSLLALTLAVGFVTDDAVVVLENVYRHLEKGLPAREAAASGAAEISFSVIGMTLSLAAVFLPFLLMGGVVGRLFSEFSVVIIASILVSGVVSLTLTPLLCAGFITGRPDSEKRWAVPRACEYCIRKLTSAYSRSLSIVLKVPFAMLVVGLTMVAATAYLLYVIPKDFLPAADTGMLSVSTEAAQGSSFEEMKRLHDEASAIITKNPDVDKAVSTVGNTSSTMNRGSFFVILRGYRPAGERRLHPEAIASRLREALYAVPGLISYPTPPPAIQFGARSGQSQYQFTLKSQDVGTLYPVADKLLAALRGRRELADVGSDLQLLNPMLRLDMDRDKLYALGLTAADVQSTLYSYFGANQVSTILGDNEQFQVIVEALPELQRNVEDLDSVYLAVGGRPIPLATVASWRTTIGPTVVNHTDQVPSVTISFNTATGVALGDAAAVVGAEAEKVLPASVSRSFQGTAQVFQSAMTSMFVLLLLAVMVIYVILGILYESYWHPVTILSGLPAAAAGGVLTLYLFGRALDIYGMVGMVLLIGLVKKNAILVVDFALEAMRVEGKPPLQAAFEGSVQRFRPIMMTTLAALAGGLIIATAGGQGGESRRGMGLVISGGLILSQLVTLYLTPVIFQYIERVRERLRRSGGSGELREGAQRREAEQVQL